MEAASDGADCPDVIKELRSKLSTDLRAMLAEHHSELQQQFRDWMDGHNSMLESFARGLAVEGVAPKSPATPEFQGPVVAPLPDPAGSSDSGSVMAVGPQQTLPKSFLRLSSFNEDSKWKKQRALMFAPVKRISERARRPSQRESNWSTVTNSAARGRVSVKALTQSNSFNYFISTIVLIQIVAMGFEVEMGRGGSNVALSIQMWCNIIFIAELALRLYAQGAAFFWGPNMASDLLDFALVSISVAEMVLRGVDSSVGGAIDNVMVVRVVRVIRIVRIARVVRLLRFFRPLRVLVRSIVATLKSLIYAILLLGMIIYSCGLVFTQAAKDQAGSERPEMSDHFGSLLRSSLTLLKCVTGGINWGDVYRPLQDLHGFYGCFLVLYIIFVTFAVLNVMTAQFCHYAFESAQKDEEEVICERLASKQFYVAKLRKLFQELAEDNESSFTLGSFERHINDERVAAIFDSLDIKVSDAWTLFRLLDEQNNDNRIDMNEFVEGCLQLKGPATAVDLKLLRREIHWFDTRLEKKFVQLAKCVTGPPPPVAMRSADEESEISM